MIIETGGAGLGGLISFPVLCRAKTESLSNRKAMTMQLSYAQIPRRPVNLMDLKEVFQFVAPQVREAAIKSARQLNHLGIRYALAGGLAVGAYGYIRATVDVDFLVGEEAFEHQGFARNLQSRGSHRSGWCTHGLPVTHLAR